MQKTKETKIGLLQFAPVLGDINTNIQKIDAMLQDCHDVDIMVLPELASSGYNFASREEAFNCSETLHQSRFINFLTEKARSMNTWFVSGINEREGNLLYNSAVLIGPDGIEGLYRKIHLFNREKLFFETGNRGIPVFETPFGTIGILICFDWMFPEAWRLMALKGAQLICHPSNLVLPYCQNAMPGYALTNRIFTATTNRVSQERDLTFTGQSVLVNPEGKFLLKAGKREEELLTININLEDANNKRMTPFNDAFDDRQTNLYELSLKEDHQTMKREKKILRKKIKRQKNRYNEDELKTIGQDAMAQLEELPEFQRAKTIFIYWSLPDEVPTHELIEKYRRQKKIILPRVVGDHLELREYSGIESLETGHSHGIQEPTGMVFTDLESIDLAVVPGLAFTKNGERLGRGGGYYDRTLPFLARAFKVGVAFPFQIIPRIPTDDHDERMDKVIAARSN